PHALPPTPRATHPTPGAPANVMRRSRFSNRPMAASPDTRSGAHDAVVVEVESRELTVSVLRRDAQRALGRPRPAADFGHRVLEAVGEHDLRARFETGLLVADGLALRVDVILDDDAPATGVDVDVQVDLREHRV